MQALVPFVLGALAWVLRGLVARLIFQLGLTVVTYVGVGSFLLDLKTAFVTEYSGLPSQIINWLGMFRVDQAALIIFAAITARLSFNTVNDSISKIVQQTPPGGTGGA